MAGIRRLIVSAAALALILQMGVGAAFATDLGRAKNFAALAGTNVVVGPGAGVADLAIGGTRATLGNGAGTADIVTNPGGIILGPRAGAGNCVTAGAKVRVGRNADCVSIDTSGSNTELSTLSGAIVDAATFATSASSQTPNQNLGAIKIGKNGTQTITDTVSGNLNVISTPSIMIGNGGSLLISGGASDTVLMLVAGNVKLAPNAVIDTRGGLPRTSLLILTSGRSVTVGHDGVLDATVLAPNANCTLGVDAATQGAYICGKHISINHDAGLVGEASTVSVP